MGTVCSKLENFGKKNKYQHNKRIDRRLRSNSKEQVDYLWQVYQQTKKKRETEKLTEDEIINLKYAIFGQNEKGESYLYYFI